MISWLGLLTTLLKLANFIAARVERNELMDAGAAKNVNESIERANKSIKKARIIRDAARSRRVPNDKYYRD